MRLVVCAGICAWMLLASAVLAEDVVERSYRVDVMLAADGSVQQVQAGPRVPESVAAFLEDRVPMWRFEPGSVDGQPAVTETSVMVRLSARRDPEDPGLALVEVMGATVGVVAEATVSPRYPVSAAQSNRQGTVVMAVDIDGEGKVLDARPHEHAPPVSRALRRAALDSVVQWTFKPERVAGQGVPATLVVPVCFTLHHNTSGSAPRTPPAGNCRCSLTDDGEGEMHTTAMTLEPAAKLLSDPTAEPTGD